MPGTLDLATNLYHDLARRVHLPHLGDRNIERTLKKLRKIIKTPYDGRYASRAFRRGGSHDTKESGPQRSVVAGAGGWRSLAFRGYVDLSDEPHRRIAKLFIGHCDLESGYEADVNWAQGSIPPLDDARRWADSSAQFNKFMLISDFPIAGSICDFPSCDLLGVKLRESISRVTPCLKRNLGVRKACLAPKIRAERSTRSAIESV